MISEVASIARMPSWSIRFEGALDDQQINDIVLYLVELSSKNVPFEDNVCLNEDASAAALETPAVPTRGILMETCLGFNIDCGILLKGGVVLMAFTLFVGSVYLLLTAVLGRWMGYLVLMVAFSGWMMVLSSLWAFGFYSGEDTPVNLGPRGAEPAGSRSLPRLPTPATATRSSGPTPRDRGSSRRRASSRLRSSP